MTTWDFYWITLRLKAFFFTINHCCISPLWESIGEDQNKSLHSRLRDRVFVHSLLSFYTLLYELKKLQKKYTNLLQSFLIHLTYLEVYGRNLIVSTVFGLQRAPRSNFQDCQKWKSKEDIQLLNSICKVFLLVAKDKNEIEGTVWFFFNFEKTKNLSFGFFHMLCFEGRQGCSCKGDIYVL